MLQAPLLLEYMFLREGGKKGEQGGGIPCTPSSECSNALFCLACVPDLAFPCERSQTCTMLQPERNAPSGCCRADGALWRRHVLVLLLGCNAWLDS